jgi:microcin C transport system substrate-binding protein
VDSSQYTDRSRKFDFDIITDQLTTGYEAGGNLRQTFGTEGFGDAFNSMGLKDPAVDSLIETAIRAQSRPEMIVAVHALDRELRALRFWIPQWFSNKYLVAYYDVFGHPETLPPYALGEMDFWWYDAEKAEKLKAAGAL